MTTSPEWMTVADAARTLGLSDRHARRLADRLSEQDRLKQGTSPLRVRLTSLSSLWEREAQSDSRPQISTESDTMSDNGSREDAVSRARLEERLDAAEVLIVELRDDKRQLQEIVQREQENHHRLLEQLSDERRDLRLIQARPVQRLPDSVEPKTASVSLPTPDAENGPIPPPPLTEPPPAPEPTPLGLWHRLARWLSD